MPLCPPTPPARTNTQDSPAQPDPGLKNQTVACRMLAIHRATSNAAEVRLRLHQNLSEVHTLLFSMDNSCAALDMNCGVLQSHTAPLVERVSPKKATPLELQQSSNNTVAQAQRCLAATARIILVHQGRFISTFLQHRRAIA